MADLDIVGGAAVDVVPVIPQFHTKLKALVLPIADKVGEEAGKRMGQAISNNIVIAIPQAINQGGRAGAAAAGRQGDNAGGAFARSLRRKLEVAFKAMPKLDVRLGDTGVDAELARLRAKLEQLSNKRIGIDVDAMAARAEVTRIEEQLRRLGAEHPNVAVRADTAAARVALAAIREEIDAVDRKRITIDVDVDGSGASSALMALTIQAAALVAIPLGPVLAAGLGGIAAMATAAAAGVGALGLAAIPAIKGVTAAMTAKTAAENEATSATNTGARASVQAAQRSLQMAGAQASLASAHRAAARSISQANRQVEDAERAVAQAVQRAADQRRQAADAVERAERSLSDAQRTARQAEQDLTQARADAARQLKALNDQLIDGALDQREATLRVQQAQLDLNATLADPMATDLQKEAAQLAFDQAQQAAKEQKQSYTELQKSAAAQKKAGVEGSDAVKTATQRLADAQRDVMDNTKAVADAQRAAARAQTEAAQTVADAQRGLADAVQNAAETQVSAAESVASAERGLASARLSGISTTTKAITKADEYQKALAKLTKPQRELFDAIAGPRGLKKAFDDWQKSLQPQVLPLFTRGVDSAKNSLPALTPLVQGAADAIETLWDKASKAVKAPFWQGFKKDLDQSVKPAIIGMGKTFGNIITGIAGIIDAFLPHMDGIAKKSDKITERFAKWGKSLKGSPDFEKFLQYVKDTAPGLADFIGKILSSVLEVSKALAPLSESMFEVLGPIIDGIKWLAENMPGVVQLLWGFYAATKAIKLIMAAAAIGMAVYNGAVILGTLITQGWAAAIWEANLAFEMNPVVAVITIIIAALVLLVAGIMYAWNHWDWFRTAVIAVWDAIKFAALFLWDNVLKPVFSAIWTGLKAIGTVAMWLWNNAIGPAFKFIGEAAQFLITALITLFLLPTWLAIKALGKVAMWLWEKAIGPTFKLIGAAATLLWDKVIKPVFGWIGDKAKWVYDKAIKPAFREAKKELDALGTVAKWLWDKVVKPVFGWIGDKAKWLWEKAIKPPFEKIKEGVDLVAAAFKLSKDNIKKHWDQLQEITKKPVRFIISHVYNGGVVPLWNQVAKITGADKLKKMSLEGFHTGGIMSGYSPGRDDRVIAVGGGEAIMRPEWTRAIGADKINEWNAAARSGGVSGVQRAINNGMPAFADGGIFGSILGGLKSAGGAVVSGAKSTADFLTNPDKLFNSAMGWAREQMRKFASSDWGKLTTEIPIGMLKSLKNSIFGGDGSGTSASGGVGRALMWARSKAGMPYQWGGAGNPSFDCSGFMSSIQKVILGQVPKGRLWSTFSFQGNNAPSGWVRNLRSPFQIGVTNAGVGHTAGTLAGVNVESRGGQGVVVGKSARGWNDPLFTSHYGFAPALAKKPSGYWAGGFPSVGELAMVGEQGPELVRFMSPAQVYSNGDTRAMARQAADLASLPAGQGGGATTVHADVRVFVGDREITDIVRTEVVAREESTASAINTGRWV
jgi:hypothetical protein